MSLLNIEGLLGPGLGKGGSAQRGAAALPAAPPGTPFWWFDFTDLSTMWQDEAGTMAVTADGQLIERIDNKGSDTAGVPFIDIEGDAGSTAPTAEAAQINGLFASQWAGAQSLSQAVVEAPPGTGTEGDWAMGLVLAPTDTTGYYTLFGAAEIYQLSTAENFIAFAFGQFPIQASPVEGAWTGTLQNGDISASENVAYHISTTETVVNAALAASGTDLDQPVVVGASTVEQGTSCVGHIGEIVIWPAALSGAEVTDWQTYVTDKYGIAWT